MGNEAWYVIVSIMARLHERKLRKIYVNFTSPARYLFLMRLN